MIDIAGTELKINYRKNWAPSSRKSWAKGAQLHNQPLFAAWI
jgi:hypothetical protein